MPAVGTPSMPTPLYNANATGGNGGTRPLPPITTNNMNREPQPHPSAQAAAANNGGTPSNATPSSDPSTNSKRSQGSSTTMPTTQDASVAHRSGQVPGANAHGTPSTAPPQQDGNPSLKRIHSLSTSTTRGGGQPYRSAQEAHHGRSDDQEKVDPGLRKYTDQGGYRTQGDEGARKLKKSPPSSKEASTRNTGTRERQGSNSSIDITMAGRGGQSYSPTDNERRSDHSSGASKAAAPPANVQSQPKHGSQHTTTYSKAHMKEKPQSANHSETGSNASDTRVGDSINPRHPQPGSKPGQLPPGAAEAQPPTARRNRDTHPQEDDSTDDHSTQPSHGVDDSADDPIQVSDDESDGSHRQPPGGLGEGQNVQGEGGENNIAPSSGYFGGIGRSIAGVILGPGGSAQPPRDRTKEELHRTRAKLQQLEYEFRRARSDNANLHRTCFELDSENRRNKETIRSLQHELTNMGRELQEYKHLSDIRGRELVSNQTTLTDNEGPLSAARAILDGTGAGPVMAVIDAMLVLRKEIVKVSDFLVENIRRTSYGLFQEELDRCYQDSEKIIGERLSKFLHDHSEAEELSQSLIKVTIQIFITSFCASEWDCYLDNPLHVEADRNTAKNNTKRKAAFLRNLISVFKIAAWVIPGSATRAAFEESLNPFFKSMKEIEAVLAEVPDSTKVSLSFVSPGEDLADFETYVKDAIEPGIQTSNEASPSQNIVLGTAALGVHCLFQDPNKNVQDKSRIFLAEKVILEANLRYIFGVQEDQKPRTKSDQRASQPEDGRDP